MSKHKHKWPMTSLKNEQGAVAAMTAILLLVLLASVAAAIDIGHALVARGELQNAADAGALAGTRRLSEVYQSMAPSAQQTYTLTGGDQAAIVAAVQTAGLANRAAGVPLTINPADISIGIWNSSTLTHAPTVNQPRSVMVTARRDGAANGPISTFLASVVGLSTVNVSATATADLTPVNAVAPGQLEAPFGISSFYFGTYGCGDLIQFYPNNGTPQACSAWTSFNQNSSANNLKNIVVGLQNGSYTTPGVAAGDTLNFTNGNTASVFPKLVELYNAKKDANGNWDVFIPVYDSPSCASSQNSGALPVVGFAEVRVNNVQAAPSSLITANVLCQIFQGNTVGGGPPYGVFSGIPGLVR